MLTMSSGYSPFSDGGAKSMKLRHRSPATHFHNLAQHLSPAAFYTYRNKRAKLLSLSCFFIPVRVGTWLAQIGFRLLARRTSQWRRMSRIMNKRHLCHKCSFGFASWCVGKSRQTSASSRTQLQVLCTLKWEKVHGSSRSNLKHIRGRDWNLCQFN